MGFLTNLFGTKKEEKIETYEDFWKWFSAHEKEFYTVIKSRNRIQENFLEVLGPKLDALRKGYFYLAGMYDDDTVELILTADGAIKQIVYVEELVAAAPELKCWKFTALKPPMNIENLSITMYDIEFNSGNLFFYPHEYDAYPDLIDISIVHTSLNDENRFDVESGANIFLENYLGELNMLNLIDTILFKSVQEAEKELIPIGKLKDYLQWREKEFIEKYEGTRYLTDNDSYTVIEGTIEGEKPLIACFNAALLDWNRHASHPWVGCFTMKFDGSRNNGLPENDDYEKLQAIEDEILVELKDRDGYLNIGHETVDGNRDIYFAFKDFRLPTKVFDRFESLYSDRYEIEYVIIKDKYWQSFDRYRA